MCKPYLIVVTGRPGAGKTTFSRALGQRAFLPVVSRDALKEGYVHTFGRPHHELPPDTNGVVTRLFFETVERLLDARVSLIAEAAFQHRLWAPWLESMRDRAEIRLLVCRAGDARAALDRFLRRGLENPRREYFHGDKGVAMLRSGKMPEPGPYEEPHLDVPTFYVDTSGDASPDPDALLKQILHR